MSFEPRSRAILFGLLVLLTTPCTLRGQEAVEPAPIVPAASSDEHIWFLRPGTDERTKAKLVIHQVAVGMESPAFTQHFPVSREPEALCAIGRKLFIAMPPTGDEENQVRAVFSLEINHNEAVDAWFTTPTGRLGIEADLPGEGVLAGMAGHIDGPVALLLPPPARRDSADVNGAFSSPQLRQLQNDDWIELELPAGFGGGRNARVAASGPNGERLVLLADDPTVNAPGDGGRTIVYRRSVDGEWSRDTAPLRLSRVSTVTRVDEQLAVVMENLPGEIEVAYIRRSELTALASMSRPSLPWMLQGVKNGLRVLEFPPDAPAMMQTIDPLSGEMSEPVDLPAHRPESMQLWVSAMVLGFMISGVLIVLMLRPTSQAPMTRPEHAVILPLHMRAFALLIDFVPGGLIAVFAMGAPVERLVQFPMLTSDVVSSLPYVLMAVIAVVHGLFTELAVGATLGKLVVGARVITAEGAKPTARIVLLRNFGKMMTLLLPPLVILVVLNPFRQQLGDLVARTLVVVKPSRPLIIDSNSDVSDNEPN